jgi:hypothetical protein
MAAASPRTHPDVNNRAMMRAHADMGRGALAEVIIRCMCRLSSVAMRQQQLQAGRPSNKCLLNEINQRLFRVLKAVRRAGFMPRAMMSAFTKRPGSASVS